MRRDRGGEGWWPKVFLPQPSGGQGSFRPWEHLPLGVSTLGGALWTGGPSPFQLGGINKSAWRLRGDLGSLAAVVPMWPSLAVLSHLKFGVQASPLEGSAGPEKERCACAGGHTQQLPYLGEQHCCPAQGVEPGGPSRVTVRSLGDSAGLLPQTSEPGSEDRPQWDGPLPRGLPPRPPSSWDSSTMPVSYPVPQSITGTFKIIMPNSRLPAFSHPVLTTP